MSTKQLIIAYGISIFCMISSCGSGTQITRTNFTGKKTADALGKKSKSSSGDPSDQDTAKSSDKSKKSEDKDASPQNGTTDDMLLVDYPQLGFRGNGYTTYKLKDKLAMKMDIETQLNDVQLSIETTSAKVECGDKSGCKQDEVDAKVKATSIGANIYGRITKNEIKKLKGESYQLPSYAIFSNKVRGKNGINFTFTKPIPVYPWPGSMSRYDDLNSSPGSWTTTVTADQYVPNSSDLTLQEAQDKGPSLEKSGKAIRQFDVTVTVSKVASSGENMTLKIETTIPADKKRALYEHFPLPRSSEYKINTESKQITEVLTTNWSNGDKSKEAEESVLTYKICTSKTKGETQDFPCQ